MAQINVKAHGEVAGYFILSTDKRGEIARFPNLITNGGLDRMGDNQDWLGWCQVGSGSSLPGVNDSTLSNRVAGTGTTSANVTGVQGSEPYYVWRRRTFRFAQGSAAGNLSEVGVGWSSSGGLFSRALILDAAGNPTSITVQSDETLDVTYEFRYYPKTTDDTGQVTLTGNIGGTYGWIFRAANVTASGPWSIGDGGTSAGQTQNFQLSWHSGSLGPITGAPDGSVISTTAVPSGYSPGSYERQFTLAADLGQANFGASGVGAAQVKMGIGTYQIGFTPKIPKTANDILSIVVKHSWARRP